MVTAEAPPSASSSMATSRSWRLRRSPGSRRRTGGGGVTLCGSATAGGDGDEVDRALGTSEEPTFVVMRHRSIGRTPGGHDIAAWIFKARRDLWDIGSWLASNEPVGSWRLADGPRVDLLAP